MQQLQHLPIAIYPKNEYRGLAGIWMGKQGFHCFNLESRLFLVQKGSFEYEPDFGYNLEAVAD